MIINDLPISSPYIIKDVRSGSVLFQWLRIDAPGDIPPGVAALPVINISTLNNTIIIETEV